MKRNARTSLHFKSWTSSWIYLSLALHSAKPLRSCLQMWNCKSKSFCSDPCAGNMQPNNFCASFSPRTARSSSRSRACSSGCHHEEAQAAHARAKLRTLRYSWMQDLAEGLWLARKPVAGILAVLVALGLWLAQHEV
eukprot:symbB.v1.2.008769.t1/scaffold549.1/size255684/10